MDHTKGAGRFAHQLIVAINLALTKMYIPSRLDHGTLGDQKDIFNSAVSTSFSSGVIV